MGISRGEWGRRGTLLPSNHYKDDIRCLIQFLLAPLTLALNFRLKSQNLVKITKFSDLCTWRNEKSILIFVIGNPLTGKFPDDAHKCGAAAERFEDKCLCP